MRSLRAPLIDLGLAANVALATVALPVYVRLYASPGLEALLRLMLLTHVTPALVLFFVARALARWRRAHRIYWGVAIWLSLLSILRAVDTHLVGMFDDVDPARLTALDVIPFDAALYASALALLVSSVVIALRRFEIPSLGVASLAPIWALATAAFIAPLALAPAPKAADPVGPAGSGPVYIFVFDGLGREVLLRDGQVDRELFPNLHALASEGLLFTNATTNWGFTCQSLPTMIGEVSLGPCGEGVLADTSRPTLFSALAGRYRVVIYEEWLRACASGAPYDCRDLAYLAASHPDRTLLAHWIPRTLRLRLLTPFGAGLVGGALTPHTLTLYEELLADLSHPRAGSTASFIHLLLPHDPFIFDADGSLHGTPDSFQGLPEDDPDTYARYTRQVRFVDTLIGRFVAALRARDLDKNATIVVTSDHGPGAGPPSQLHPYVTLIMRGPGVPTGTTDIDYQHVDLTPTLTALLGLEPVPHSEGISVFATERPSRDKRYRWRGEGFWLDPAQGRWVREP